MATQSSRPSNLPCHMPPVSANLETLWAFLKAQLDDIMKNPTPTSNSQHMSIYTTVYNYCTSGRFCYASEGVPGGALYNELDRYFAAHSETLAKKSDSLKDEVLLRYYAGEWDKYKKAVYYINRLFHFLNAHWVASTRSINGKPVYPVYTLALVQWKLAFLLHMQENRSKLSSAILKLIKRRRSGETIDQDLIKTVVESLFSPDMSESDIKQTSLDVYKSHMESPLLKESTMDYQQKFKAFHTEGGITAYLRKTREFLEEEELWVDSYLDTETRKQLIKIREHIFIRPHWQFVLESFQDLLDSDTTAELNPIWALLSRVPGALESLRKTFEEHVKNSGLTAVSKLDRKGSQGSDSGGYYVGAVAEVHRKYSEIVTHRLGGEDGFCACLDNACRLFVNRDVATGISRTKPSELLANYVDMLLRWNRKTAKRKNIADALDRAMTVFRYIEDKDVFLAFYTTKLSNRLIKGLSGSDESEVGMITRLREACGSEYTEKLQLMLADVSLSKDMTIRFKKRIRRKRDDMGITFRILVLRTNSWPIVTPDSSFNVPTEIMPVYDRFSKYYQARHTGRKLIWLWNYSKHELKTNYFDKEYILMTNSYQMAVLLQYNNHDSLSLENLLTATEINLNILTQVLSSLAKSKILLGDKVDRYDLNSSFKSKGIRVHLNQPIKVEEEAKSPEFKTVDEDRTYLIEAAIVRIMKKRKIMKNRPLIQEVKSQVSRKFVPKVPDIKKAIDALLEKEYIERLSSKDTFMYVA